MANKSTVIRITHPKNRVGGWRLGREAKEAREEAIALASLFERIAGGLEPCSFEVALTGTALVRASATITFTDVPTAAVHSVQVGATVFAAVAEEATPTATEFKIGTTAAGAATNLGAAINANTTTNKFVVATVADKVVTITALHGGAIGNQVEFAATGGGPYTLTGSGYLASGAGDDVAALSYSRA